LATDRRALVATSSKTELTKALLQQRVLWFFDLLERTLMRRSRGLPAWPAIDGRSRAGIFPDDGAPIVRETPDGREIALARWGMPSPVFALKGKKTDPGVTNIRKIASLAAMAGTRKPMPGAVYQLLRK
jgi:hypothetical protein